MLEFDERTLKPVLTDRDVTFIWIRVNNIYIVAVARGNPNVVLVLTFLHKMKIVFESYFKELEDELRGEVEVTIGPIERIQFFPENPSQGIVKIKFESSLHAEECIKVMSGRFFDGRVIKAAFWDGKTDYRTVRETADELN